MIIDVMNVTKIIRPNAFPVPNPLSVFTAFMEMIKIQTANAIVTIATIPTYPNTGPNVDKISSLFNV